MNYGIGNYVDVFNKVLENDANYGLGKVQAIEGNRIKVEIIMTKNGKNEGEVYLLEEKDLSLTGNKQITEYEDYLKWKKIDRRVYEYKIGDIIKDFVTLQLFTVKSVEDGEVKAWCVENGTFKYEEFYQDDSTYGVICKVEDRVDEFFK